MAKRVTTIKNNVICLEPPPLRSLERTMTAAAEAAAQILLKYFRNHKLHVRVKKNAGLVTKADIEAERAARRILSLAHPDFGMLTEELSPRAKKDRMGRWIIDPLDGTTNYIHGFPMFCVSIAAEWNGEVIAGVIHHPILRDTYVALRGRGAFVNGHRMHVSKTRRLRDSLLSTGFTYRKGQWLRAEMEAFERISAVVRAVRRPGSAALDLAYTARGVFDGFWERRLSPWDVAAGFLLVQEAGGKVTDFKGNSFKIDSPEILASNSLLHPKLLESVG